MNALELSLAEPQAAAVPRPAAPLVVLTGGKGGVGKTALSANLGVGLARRGARVLLIDLDLGLANLDVLLSLNPARTLEDFLESRATVEECIRRGPAGVDLLPAGSGNGEMARPDAARRRRLLEGIAAASAGYDLLIGDTAAGIGPDVLAFCAAADHVLAVTTPDPTALTDAYGLLRALDRLDRGSEREIPTPELVVNLCTGAEEAERSAAKLRLVCERFLARSPRLAGWVPRSSNVLDACSLQRPFALSHPSSLAARCVGRLCEHVARQAGLAGRLLKV